jgi:hypothetical protein
MRDQNVRWLRAVFGGGLFDNSVPSLDESGRFRFARCENAKRLGCSLLFDGVRPRAVLFCHLRCRNNSAAKFCKLHKLALDCL